jgi:hypothetical protein
MNAFFFLIAALIIWFFRAFVLWYFLPELPVTFALTYEQCLYAMLIAEILFNQSKLELK